MIFRLTILLLAFGIVLQGCTLQKRSLMPGWYVEKLGQASDASGTHIAEPVAEILTEESLQTVVVAPSFVDPFIPVKALMAFSSQVENARVLKLPLHVPRANWHEPQPIHEVVPSTGVKLTHQSSIEDDSKQKRIALSVLAALLCVGSVIAFDFFFSLLGFGLLAAAWIVLRVAFPKSRRQAQVEAESPQQFTGQTKGMVMRIALGLLGALLAWVSGFAFVLAFFDRTINWGLLLVGVGLLALALGALSVTFPRLRALFKRQNKPDAATKEAKASE